jgi:hypothetical protein
LTDLCGIANNLLLNSLIVNVIVLVLRTFCSEPAKVLRLCCVFNGITQFYLPAARLIPARAEQYLEHYIRNELLGVAAHLTDLERMEA